MLGTANRDRAAERRAATRREILDAAWQLAGERGLAGFTLSDVAGLVGMRAPSLYTHFDSKMAIYDAMFGDAWAQYLEHVPEQGPEPPAGPPGPAAPDGAGLLRLQRRRPAPVRADEPAGHPRLRAVPGVLRPVGRGPGACPRR